MLDNQPNKTFKKIVYPSITDEVANQILNAIREDVYIPGDKLPSEPDLAEQMGVSRNTLREAMNTLIEKGYLYRQRGIGTFITLQSAVMLKANLADVVGTTALISNQNKIPGQIDFMYQYELPSKQVAENLQITETVEVMHISRVRTADGIPVIKSEEYFCSGINGMDYDLAPYTNSQNWSIYEHFLKANYRIQTVITRVHAIIADKEMASKLKLEENTTLLFMESTHFSSTHAKPIMYSLNYHNDKILNLMLVRSV
jgi:GntR family transcriptional regulator